MRERLQLTKGYEAAQRVVKGKQWLSECSQ
jgi:hypothetical protein